MPAPRLHRLGVNGTQLAYFEHGAPQQGRPTLLFVHATGFHGRVWDSVIARLGDCHCIAVEQRGHGRSESRKVDHWQVFHDDLTAFVQALGLSRLIGVGHSMGAHVLVPTALATDAFERLLLLDPTIMDPDAYGVSLPWPELKDGEHPVARRYNRFESAEDMMQRLRHKGSYHLFDPEVFRDYCEHGLLAVGEGMTLACLPEVEAAIYLSSRTSERIFESVDALDIPVLVVRARAPVGERGIMDLGTSPTWPGLAARFPQGREIYRPDLSHFIPMQAPAETATLILDEMSAWVGARASAEAG